MKIALLHSITIEKKEFLVEEFKKNLKLLTNCKNDEDIFLLKDERKRYYLNEILSSPISHFLMNSQSQKAKIIPIKYNDLALWIKYEKNLKTFSNIIKTEKVIQRNDGHFYLVSSNEEISIKEALSTTYQNQPLPEIFYREDVIWLVVQGFIISKLDQHCSNLCLLNDKAFNIDNGMALPFWQYKEPKDFISVNIQNLFYYFISRGYVASLSEWLLGDRVHYVLNAAAEKILANKNILMENFKKSISSIVDNPEILKVLKKEKLSSKYKVTVIAEANVEGQYYWNLVMSGKVQQVLLTPDALWDRIEVNANNAKLWAAAICKYKGYNLPENCKFEPAQIEKIIQEIISLADYNKYFNNVAAHEDKSDFTAIFVILDIISLAGGIAIAAYKQHVNAFFKRSLRLEHAIGNHISTIFVTLCFFVSSAATVVLVVQKTSSIDMEFDKNVIENSFFENMFDNRVNVC